MSLGYILLVCLIVYVIAVLVAPGLQTGYGFGSGGVLLLVVIVVLLTGRKRTL
jgi:hypothetical protein